jgi:hypothetical protein
MDLLEFRFLLCADALRDLIDEIKDLPTGGLVTGGEYGAIGKAKITHVMGLAALSAILDDSIGYSHWVSSREIAKGLISRNLKNRYVWGEPAAPHVLTIALFLERYSSSRSSDEFWSWAIRAVVDASDRGSTRYHPPWETITEEIAKKMLGLDTGAAHEARGAYWAEAFVLMGVRLNLKSLTRAMWPTVVTMPRLQFLPEERHDFFRFKCMKGKNETILRKLPVGWGQLLKEIGAMKAENTVIVKKPYWYLLILMVYPHRVQRDSLLALFPEYAKGCWY